MLPFMTTPSASGAVSAPDTPPPLSVRATCARLAVSRSWLYQALAAGTVTGQRFGRSWRIPAAEVDRLAREGAPSPRQETNT